MPPPPKPKPKLKPGEPAWAGIALRAEAPNTTATTAAFDAVLRLGRKVIFVSSIVLHWDFDPTNPP
jgi:hypothetical protein